jgi:hypothetical protein
MSIHVLVSLVLLLAWASPARAQTSLFPTINGSVQIGVLATAADLTVPTQIPLTTLATHFPSDVIYETSDPAKVAELSSLGLSVPVTVQGLANAFPGAVYFLRRHWPQTTDDSRFSGYLGGCGSGPLPDTATTCSSPIVYWQTLPPTGMVTLTVKPTFFEVDIFNAAAMGAWIGTFKEALKPVVSKYLTFRVDVMVAKGNQSISFGAAPTVRVGATGNVTVSSSSGAPVSVNSATPATCSVTATTVSGLSPGTCTVTGNQAGTADYEPAPQATQSFTILKGIQAIVFGPAPTLRSGSTAALSATGGSSGNPVVFASTTPGTCTVAGAIVTGVAAGVCAVTGNQAGNANYDPAAQATLTFAVNAPTEVVNLSTRGRVLTGEDVMIGGFVIQGSETKTVVIVATGPSLAAYGIASPLQNPTLTLVRSSDQAIIASNDDWQAAANASQILASGFAPSDPREAAILVTLQPGAYTAILSGVGGTSGVGVIAVYALPMP